MRKFRDYLKEFNYPSNTKVSGDPSPEVSDPDGAIPLGDENGEVGGDDTGAVHHHHKRYEIHFIGNDSGKKHASDEEEAAEMMDDILANDPHAKIWVIDRMTGEKVHPKEEE